MSVCSTDGIAERDADRFSMSSADTVTGRPSGVFTVTPFAPSETSVPATTSADYKKVKFTAVFDAKRSWVVKGYETDAALLEHEKLHLAMAEYLEGEREPALVRLGQQNGD